ncbi:MAG TPA: dienelactone hydrolase family protein, partial [Gemmatimonadaceae bacterium]|nr:dienelactone hydrolase family protein [Gemmatimonadaceae bacterium]
MATIAIAAQANAQQDYAAMMYRMHHDERPVANASWIAPRTEVDTERVAYMGPVMGNTNGYLARPHGGGHYPAVVMIHEWWGLNDNIRMEARRLAGEGYTVLAVDLYHGKTAQKPDDARNLVLDVVHNPSDAIANLNAAVAYLKSKGAQKIGVMGWCFGGAWSIQEAVNGAGGIDADIAYYGTPVTDPAKLAKMPPFLGLYGSLDDGIPTDSVKKMQTALEGLHKPVEVKIYDGAHHAFANPSGQHYDKAAADDAWQR